MIIPTPDSLRASRRRVGRLKNADAVLSEMRAGAALHLQHTRQGPCWTLSNGRPVPESIAKLVIASSSVTVVGDALFDVPSTNFSLVARNRTTQQRRNA
jgi:hypothetical protein